MSAGARPHRPVIRLSCPSTEPALCRALIQALAEHAPGRVIRPVAPGTERPTLPEDLGVALIRKDGALQLGWLEIAGAMQLGTALAQDGPGDAVPLPQNAATRLADDLLQASPALRATLSTLR